MKHALKSISAFLVIATICLLTGCETFSGTSANKSSLVEFLYPDTNGYVEPVEVPQLRLPLRVGIAFTPATQRGVADFSEVQKSRLAQNVANKFADLEFVHNIEIIPSDYLRRQGSFTNLDQLRQLFNIDVIVLLSYDQSIFVDEGLMAFTYWTIVGAYIVPGQKNDTQTLIDAAVYDIASRKLLFRAPGASLVKSRETLVGNSEKLREDSVQGFTEASEELSTNLSAELERFQQRVKETPAEFQISAREGYTGIGSGSVDGWFLFMLAALFSVTCLLRKIGRSN
jgi:rhombotail lipoprotein